MATLEECWKPSFARHLIPKQTGLRHDLRRYLRYYNTDRAHTGLDAGRGDVHLAELIDNSIDAFLEGQRGAKTLTLDPNVTVELPSGASLDAGAGELIVRDNGPGMTEDELEKAVKAGYSGNDPVEKLGLFGMGFNIATARLGKRTEVWTTTAESGHWIGVEIDFDRLEEVGEFHAPRLQRAKTDEEVQRGHHATEVRVSKLERACAPSSGAQGSRQHVEGWARSTAG